MVGFANLPLVEGVSTRGVTAQLDTVDPNANLHMHVRYYHSVVLTLIHVIFFQNDGRRPDMRT